MPRVLFSAPECRIIAVDLRADEEMGDHRVRERALVTVVAGRVSIESSGTTADCPTGTLVVFEPGERHRVYALTDARLLLVLAPWPASDHFPDHVPANAVAGSLPPKDDSSARPGAVGAHVIAAWLAGFIVSLLRPTRPPTTTSRYATLDSCWRHLRWGGLRRRVTLRLLNLGRPERLRDAA